MKKLLSLGLVFIFAFVLSGCDFLEGEEVNEAPYITGSDYLAFQIGSDMPDWKDYIECDDAEDGTIRILDSMIDASNVDMNTAGIYIVEVYVSDSQGKSAMFEIRVEIVDARVVTIDLVGDEVVTLEVFSEYIEQGAIATYADGDVIEYTIIGTIDTSIIGEQIVEYYVDSKGLSVYRKVVIVDTTAPTIDFGDFEYTYMLLGDVFVDYEYIIEDNYYEQATITVVTGGTFDPQTVGTYYLEYVATDLSGNVSDTFIRTVTVVDGELPLIIINGGTEVTIEYGGEYEELGGVVLLEDGMHILTIDGTVNDLVVGDYTINYSYTDSNSVEYNMSKTVHIIDTVVPEITLLGDAEITLEFGDLYTEPFVVVLDNYDQELVVDVVTDLDLDNLGTYTISYSTTDSSGNISDTVTRTIIIVDTTSPEITLNSVEFYYVTLDSDFVEPGLTIIDNYPLDDIVYTIIGEVDTSVEGENVITYMVTDVAGNESIVLTRTVIVIDSEIPFAIINGEANVTILYMETYEELGAQVVFQDEIVDMEIIGEVEIDVIGEYTLTYVYTDVNNVVFTVYRTVFVVDVVAPTVALIGDETILLPNNSEYFEFGVTMTDNYEQESDLIYAVDLSNLDMTTNGTYEIYYTASDLSGNTSDAVTRYVKVVHNTPVLEVTNIEGTHDSIVFDVNVIDPNGILTNGVLTIKDGDTVIGTYDIVSGENSITLTGLTSSYDYTVTFNGDYDIEDDLGTVSFTFYNETVSTREVLAPSYSVVSTDSYENALSIDIGLSDDDGVIGESYVVLYKDNVEVERQLINIDTELYTFETLASATYYKISMELTYDLNDGNGVISKNYILKSSITTLPTAPTVTSFVAQAEDVVLGDIIPFVLEIENTSNLYVYSIVVNGVEITDFKDGSTRSLLIFDMPSGEEAGMQTFTFEEIKVYYNAEISTYTMSVDNTVDVKVFREIKVLGVEPTNGEITVNEYTDKMMTITIDNPEGYTIESININGVTYEKADFVSASTTAIVLNVAVQDGGDGGRVQEIEVKVVEYSDGEVVMKIGLQNGVLSATGLFVYDTLVINHISTVEDLQNINIYGYYVLDNDIDLSGINWDPIEQFRGYLDGRGYVIRNLTITETTNSDENRKFGLFEYFEGYIINLGIEGLDINILALYDASYLYDVGGIGGQSYGMIVNSYVIGKFEINNVSNLHIGGLVGQGNNCSVIESYTKGEIIVNVEHNLIAGGIIGNGSNNYINNVYSEMNITFSSKQGFNVGGIMGDAWGNTWGSVWIETKISNTYYIGEIVREGNEGWGRVGGIVAALTLGTLYNVYTENYLVVGYANNSTIKNAYTLNPIDYLQFGEEYYESRIDITEITSLSEIDFEVDLGMYSGVWDFSGDYPILLSVDNTPTYISDTSGSTTGLTADLPIELFVAVFEDIYLGDNIPFVLQIENTSNLHIYSIVVNGVEINEFRDGSTNSLLIFDMPSGDVAGVQTFTLEEIKVYYSANLTTYTMTVNNTVDANIYRKIEVLGIEPTDGEVAVKQYTDKMMTVTIDNPEGYTIESININGTIYEKVDFISTSTTIVVLSIPVNWGGDDGRIEEFEVLAVEFSDGETTKKLESQDGALSVTGLFIYDILVINHVSTVEDLQNIGEYGYYVLDNDIDLSGINWDPIEQFRGYLDGNGYVIRNLTIEEITNSIEHRRFGLFALSEGYITNLGVEGLDINILALYDAHYDYFIGGIAGYNTGIIVNSYVIGRIEVNNVPYLYVGGIAGYAHYGVIDECYTKGEILVEAKEHLNVGGILGRGYRINIINVYSEMNITFSIAQDFSIGGIVGQTHGQILINKAYYIGEITKESNDGWGRIGGIIGEVSDGTIYNVYTENYDIAGNAYESTIKNAYVLNLSEYLDYSGEFNSTTLDITEITSLSEIDFEVNLEMNSGIWDFSGDYPLLLSVDNTPTYTAIITETTTGLTDDLPIELFVAVDEDIYLGDNIPFVLEIENTSNLMIYSIVVNGVDITEFREASTNSLLIFDMPSGETPGIQTFIVEEIKVFYNSEITTYTMSINNTLDVNILRKIEVLGIEPTDGEIAVEQYTNKMMTVTMDNPEGYIIESININGVVYEKAEFISASTTAVVLNVIVGWGGDDGRVREFEVIAVEFTDGEIIKKLELYQGVLRVTELFVYETLTITHISTVEDLQNIGQYGYYVLDNDIDLSGINWDPIETFKGYLDGKGYVIRNLTIEEITNSDEQRRFGLFEYHNGYITNLGMEGLNINITALYDSSYEYYVGGMAGYSDGIIVNSYVIGKIEVNGVLNIMVGGIVGFADRFTIEESYTKGEIIVNAKYTLKAGGIIGQGGYIDIKNVYSEMDITFDSNNDNRNIGGIIGHAWGQTYIDKVYYIGEIIKEGNENWPRIGGIIGQFQEGTISRAYTEKYNIFGNADGATIKGSYILNLSDYLDESGQSNSTLIDITEITSLDDIDFELDLGMNSGVWDFSGDYPLLLSVDNTPIYTTE
jgi:hypothetical protein